MPIRVLQICTALTAGGGVQKVIQNYYDHMDQNEFVFDVVVQSKRKGEMEEWFEQRGSHIFHVPRRSESFIGNTRALARIIRNGNYDVVHCHQDYKSATAMLLAKWYGVKTRIVHSHLAFPQEKTKAKMIRLASTWLLKRTANVFLGCGRDAARWLYGEKMLASGKAKVLNNAIELERYAYSEENRKKIREELGLKNKMVIGHVGRFTYQKNQKLLIDIFAEYAKQNPEAVLVSVGKGELMEEVQTYSDSLGLGNRIKYLGLRDDVPEILSAFDGFVLPSRFEGLAIVMVEVQANGLPVVCSPYVTEELKLTSGVEFVSEEKYADPFEWCAGLDRTLEKGRYNGIRELTEAGFSIREEAKKLEQLYSGKSV